MGMIRNRIANAAAGPFRHVEYPLRHSFDYMGDPGLHGPGSVSWKVLGDVASIIGGIRGLLIQAAHPEVVAGVGDHSRYREDPLGRLSRTSSYVTATTYGAIPEVEAAIEAVRRIHRRVNGVSERGIAYDASDPGFSAWVHNALTDSLLVANQVFGQYPLSDEEADAFVVEQQKVGALLDSDPMPDTARALHVWIAEHPDADSSQAMVDAVEFLENPPLSPPVLASYKVLRNAAIATIPVRIRRILGLEAKRGAISSGKMAINGLRWAMGFSPSWHVALIRSGADIPDGLFRQEIPIPLPQKV
jgi:uncharacterized protein (DUF2236 family)